MACPAVAIPSTFARDWRALPTTAGNVVAAGVQKWTQWGYACRPAGAAAGRNAARGGAVIACWWARAERK